MPDLLELAGVNKRYGGVWALRDAGLTLRRGEVHALVGENGAGKSTLAKIVAGSVVPDSGAILLDGKPAHLPTPLAAQRLGIGMIFQELDLFPHLTVGDNMVINNLRFREGRVVSRRRIDEFCRPVLEQVGLGGATGELVRDLPIGHQQLVAIARALSMEARILLMDEPTSSLFDDAAERLFGLIAELKRRGVSVVYVSHKMDEILRVADRVTVLRDGANVGTREARDTGLDELIRMMVGRELDGAPAADSGPRGEPLLSVEGLVTDKLKDISFQVASGEILGIAGLVGAGRSELGRAMAGLDRLERGTIRMEGRTVQPRSPREAWRLGLALLPEDRKLEGLMMQMSVAENSTLAVIERMHAAGFVRRRREEAAIRPLFDDLVLKTASHRAPLSQLSGGNQQKVLLAKCLLADPRVLFLDDPTRGIDIGAKHDIHRIIAGLALRGKAVIFVSSELPELLSCCHRILVMRGGRIAASFHAGEATEQKIMAAAAIAGAAF